MPRAAKSVAATFLILMLVVNCSADLRVRIKESRDWDGRNSDNYDSWFFKGRRSRWNSNNYFSLYQCDSARAIYADNELERYEIEDSAEQAKRQPKVERARLQQEREAREKRAGGTITVSVHVEDTGERREIFGYTARRIKTTTLVQTSPDACSQANVRREIDGWYADLLYGLGCSVDISGKNPADEEIGYAQFDFGMLFLPDPNPKNFGYYIGNSPYRFTKDCVDRVRIERRTTARLGFPLVEIATDITSWNPQPTIVKREVVELDTRELDPALFEIPAGYKRVKRGKLHS